MAAPAIQGWTATVDDKRADVVVQSGLLAVDVTDARRVEFRHHVPGLWLGALVSLLALVASLGLAWVARNPVAGPAASPGEAPGSTTRDTMG